MPSLDDTKPKAPVKAPEEIDDWDVLTGGGEEEKEAESDPAETPISINDSEIHQDVAAAMPPPHRESVESKKPKPAAAKKLAPKKSDKIISDATIKFAIVDSDRLSRGASILQDIGEVLIYLGGIIKQDCEKREKQSHPMMTTTGDGEVEPAVPSRIRILVEPESDADGFIKGDEFNVAFIHESGTVFIIPENNNGDLGFNPGEFEVIAWESEGEPEETETDIHKIMLADAELPMAECLSRSRIRTLGDLVDFLDADKPLETLPGVGTKKAVRIREALEQYFIDHPELMPSNTEE